MQYSKLVAETIRDIYNYMLLASFNACNIRMSRCDSVSSFSRIEKIATFQTLKTKLKNEQI